MGPTDEEDTSQPPTQGSTKMTPTDQHRRPLRPQSRLRVAGVRPNSSDGRMHPAPGAVTSQVTFSKTQPADGSGGGVWSWNTAQQRRFCEQSASPRIALLRLFYWANIHISQVLTGVWREGEQRPRGLRGKETGSQGSPTGTCLSLTRTMHVHTAAHLHPRACPTLTLQALI